MSDVKAREDDVQVAPDALAHAAKPSAPAPEMPPTAAAFAGKAKDLAALRDAVVDAANVGAGLWFSYLFVLLYLIVAVGSVTHRNLLFESPLKLPFLNVDLPLVGFFVLGPALFLIVHAYVLLHFAMLATKVGVFHAELQAQIADDTVRARLRRQLPSNIFVQFLAGPVEVRSGQMGAMLRLIAQISLVAGPLALLVFFQLQFLPYHDEAVSWWQRIAVVADLALLWILWPSVARGETSSIAWRDLRRPHVVAAAVASVVPVWLVFMIATFPGEWLDRNPVSAAIVPQSGAESIRWATPHKLLVAGDVDLINRKPTSLWSNRLVLPGLDDLPKGFSLRGRHLEGAVLLAANLQRMDFTAAQLQGAVLNDADLREARFLCAESRLKVGADATPDEPSNAADQHCAELRHAYLIGARLEKASFKSADMQGARFDQAQAQDAIFDNADLRDAKFWRAQLQGARFDNTGLEGATLDLTNLQGASLTAARMQGASLLGADLTGASLDRASLGGASLFAARLWGASLSAAELRGASVDQAQLQGASFYQARLHGASLDKARLQGASFEGAQLEGTSLQQVLAWRTSPPAAQAVVRIASPDVRLVPAQRGDCDTDNPCDWSEQRFAALKRLILERLPDGDRRNGVLQRIASLDPATPLAGEGDMAKRWTELAGSPPSPSDYNKTLVDVLQQTGCSELVGGPDVIRGLTRDLNERLGQGSQEAHAVAAKFLDQANCPGASGLSDDTRAKLTEVKDSGPPAPPSRIPQRAPQR